jgi:hypothetical protein
MTQLEQRRWSHKRVFTIGRDGISVVFSGIGRKQEYHVPFMAIPAKSITGATSRKGFLAAAIVVAFIAFVVLGAKLSGSDVEDTAFGFWIVLSGILALIYAGTRHAYTAFRNQECHLEFLPNKPGSESLKSFIEQMQQAKLEYMVRRYRRLTSDAREYDITGEMNHLVDAGIISEDDYEYLKEQMQDDKGKFGFK